MAEIVYIEESALDWAGAPDTWEGKVMAGEPDVRYKMLADGASGTPSVQLVEYEPGHHEQPHSHARSEFLYVLDGDATFGDHAVRAGMLVHVPANTVYGPIDSGPSGMRFLRVDFE